MRKCISKFVIFVIRQSDFFTFPEKTRHILISLRFCWHDKDVNISIIFLLFPTPLSIKMVISSNLWRIINMIMSMSPESDLIINVLPFATLAASTRVTNLESASSWSLDFSVTMKASCWVIFRQWFTFEKYVVVIARCLVQFGKYISYFATYYKSKTWETRKIFVNIARENVR